MGQHIKTELSRGVFTITLADPDNRNALSRGLAGELREAMDRVDTDPDVRVVVLTNEGTVFCAGADLSERSTGGGDETGAKDSGAEDTGAEDTADEAPDPLGVFGRIRRSPKPWIGRIHGHAVAGGLGLAAATDISVAIDTAKMGFSEVRIGVAPAIISVICLPKMRAADAAEAFLRGNRFLAPEAARLGLINYAVAETEIDARVAEIVDDILLGGPAALAATKRVINDVPHMAFDEAMESASALSASLFESAEGQEGMQAYLEKRPPAWASEKI